MDNPLESYSRIKRYIDFANIPGSVLVRRGGNRHCVTYGIDCGIGTAEMQAAAQAWWDQGEKACPPVGRYRTAELALPATLPTDRFISMRWPLSALRSDLGSGVFELEVQLFSAPAQDRPGALQLRKPRLAPADQAVQYRGIRLLVNGQEDIYADRWASLDGSIAPSPMPGDASTWLPHPVLSAEPVLIVFEGDVSAIKIAVAFDELSPGTVKPCRALSEFEAKVMPVVTARNCLGCHATDSARWNMSQPVDQLCAGFLSRMNLKDFSRSSAVAYPVKGAFGHPRVVPTVSEVIPSWRDWMRQEVAQP